MSDTVGGGVVAGWRITGLLLKRGENKRLPNAKGGGWKRADVKKLLDHDVYNSGIGDNDNNKIGNIDVVVVRIPHGWIGLVAIKESFISQGVDLAHTLFGVRNFIYMSLPIVNNIVTPADLEWLHKRNAMIKSFARKMTTSNSSRIDNVLVLDFARLANGLIEWNGELLGMNTTANTTINNTEYDFRLEPQWFSEKGFTRKYAQVCNPVTALSSPNVTYQEGCTDWGNGFTLGGMHWCTESLNGRLNGGAACLMQCMYSNYSTSDEILACETDCNDRFMDPRRPMEKFADVDIIDDNNVPPQSELTVAR